MDATEEKTSAEKYTLEFAYTSYQQSCKAPLLAWIVPLDAEGTVCRRPAGHDEDSTDMEHAAGFGDSMLRWHTDPRVAGHE